MGSKVPAPGADVGASPPGGSAPSGGGTTYRGEGGPLGASPGIWTARMDDAGTWRFSLGSADQGYWQSLVAPTRSEVSFLVDLTDVDTVTFDTAVLVPEDAVSLFVGWIGSVLVDGAELVEFRPQSGMDGPLRNISAPVSRYYGVHEITLRWGWQSTSLPPS